MQKYTNCWSFITALFLTVTVLAACAPGTTTAQPVSQSQGSAANTVQPATTQVAAEPTQYPTLRILTSFQIKSMDPVKQGFWYSEFGAAELLMKWDRDFVVKPWVLKALDQVDTLSWRLTLRPEVRFQNGKPLDAAALAALLRRQLKLVPEAQADLPGAAVEVTGPYEIVLTTQKPTPTLPNILADESDFPVYDVAAVEAVGEDYDKLIGSGLYTGPYEVVSLSADELLMKRYDGYWQGVPPLPGVKVGFVADAQARIMAVENGEADIAIYVPSEAKRLLKGRNDVFFVTAPSTREGVRLITNLRIPPFDDLAVRRAFSLGVDYATIATNVLDNVYTAATGYYPQGFPFLVENQKYDPKLAAKVLDDAGWKMGANGVRAKDGQLLQVTLLIYPQQPDLVPMSTAIQAMLKPVGFDVEIQSMDDISAVMKNNRVKWNAGLTYDGAISGGGALQLHRQVHSQGSYNFGGINDPRLDSLIDRLDITFDEATRLDLLHQIQGILVEQQAYDRFVANKLFPAVVSRAYRNYLPSHNWEHITFETKPAD